MKNKVIVTVAPTSNFHGKEAHPALPEQPDEIARSVREAYDAGACLAHMHARDENGHQTNSAVVYRRINAAVRAQCDIIIQNSIAPANGAIRRTAEDGLEVLDAHPEMSSLDMGICVINMRDGPEYTIGWTNVFLIRAATIMQERGIRPELEIFNNAQMDNVRLLIDQGLLVPPFSYSFVMGMNRINQTGASWHPKTLMSYVDALPPQSRFSTLGIGPTEHHATVQSLLLGGGVRVGFEDNLHYRRGELAKSNAHLVERIVNVVRDLGLEPATPSEARDMLGIPQLGSHDSIELRSPQAVA